MDQKTKYLIEQLQAENERNQLDNASLANQRDESIAQRDKLLAALERIMKQQETIGQIGNSAWTTATAAIAAAKQWKEQ